MKVCKLSTILRQLSSPDRLDRNAAVCDLTGIGEAARPALPALKKLLNDEPLISIGAAGIISEIEPDDEDALKVLVNGLNEDQWGLHISMACEFLGKLGPKAQFTVPLLMPLLDHEWETVRCDAAEAIGFISGDWAHFCGVCVALLNDEDWLNRYLAEEYLLLAGKHSKVTILKILRIALDVLPSWELRLEVEDVIEKLAAH